MTLERVVLTLCTRCIDGEAGECHTPGCALWMNRAPDVPIRDKIEATETSFALNQERS